MQAQQPQRCMRVCREYMNNPARGSAKRRCFYLREWPSQCQCPLSHCQWHVAGHRYCQRQCGSAPRAAGTGAVIAIGRFIIFTVLVHIASCQPLADKCAYIGGPYYGIYADFADGQECLASAPPTSMVATNNGTMTSPNGAYYPGRSCCLLVVTPPAAAQGGRLRSSHTTQESCWAGLGNQPGLAWRAVCVLYASLRSVPSRNLETNA